MTLTRKRLLFGAAVVAIVALFAATDVTAQDFPLEGIPLERDCTITVAGGSVDITAGFDGNPEAVFPRLIEENEEENGEECPDGPPCLAWDYRWVITGLPEFEFRDTDVSASTDITVLGCEPECNVQMFFPIIAEGERLLDFDPDPVTTVFNATYYTPVGVGPGTMTATFVAKKEWWNKRFGTCAIAGAKEVGEEPELPTTISVFETVVFNEDGDTCEIERKIDLLNCQIGGEIIPGPNCPEDPDPSISATETLKVSNGGGPSDPAISASCDLVFTQTGSFRYCWPNSAGSMTCITF